ncbi:uncharacterized protein LOC117541720 isoform X1 [Gymnodraco acuticeps]|uniref:Uncharacterized protein LOC117541720 isoform X1 n=1 Tax=Gymnodraco acuticeps TaxID=8218 RepID=A0A6P8TKY7_GYMAC|nr:uncharacterized protein LOC117541720 isoform X1 [Gymnodraco acuticeps]
MFIGFAGRLKPQPANSIKASNYMLRHIYTTMKITLRDSSPVVLTHNQCSCVAGTVLCNHTVALLFQTAHYTELNMPVVPPVHSCTESEQQWHKPRTMGVKPGPINSMVFTKPVPNRMVQTGVRSGFYRGMVGPLPDPCLFRVTEAYSAFSIEDRPLVTTMNMRPDKPLVESAFGIVQEGSVLSYQMPALTSRYTTLHTDTPPTPHLPIEGYVILPCDLPLVCSEEEQLLMNSLSVDLEMSHKIEEATREQSSSSEWHLLRTPRVTASRFREICHVRGESSANSLAERILKGTRQTAEMRRGAEMEPTVAAEYSRLANVNYSPCGLVIHPSTPWLGASPDGVVFDPTEYPQFGLVEFKCPNVPNYVDCKYVQMECGSPKLKKSHAYYWQVQGQLLVSGMQWCDFVVWAQEDYLVQRIYTDPEVQRAIREKVDFFFYTYMPKYLSLKK